MIRQLHSALRRDADVRFCSRTGLAGQHTQLPGAMDECERERCRSDLRARACHARASPGTVNAGQWPFPGHHDNGMFAVSVNRDAAQIKLEGPSVGPGGAASLNPLPDLELIFDRTRGHLSEVVVEAGEPCGPVVPGEPALGYLGRVFGNHLAAAVRQAPCGGVPPVGPRPHPAVIAALSRLARLGAAWCTTPVPCSPLWALEAADLARQCQRRATLARASFPSAARTQSCPAAVSTGETPGGWSTPPWRRPASSVLACRLTPTWTSACTVAKNP